MILILWNVSVAIYRMPFFVGLSSSLDDVCYYRDWYEEGPIDRVLFVCWPHTCTGHNTRDSIKKRIIYSPLFITKFAIYFPSSALFAYPHHRHHGRWNYLLVTVFCLPPTVTKWIYTRRHNNYPQSDPGWSLVVTRRMSRSDAGGDRGTDKFDEHVFIYFSHTKYHFPVPHQLRNRCPGHNDAPRIRWLISGVAVVVARGVLALFPVLYTVSAITTPHPRRKNNNGTRDGEWV